MDIMQCLATAKQKSSNCNYQMFCATWAVYYIYIIGFGMRNGAVEGTEENIYTDWYLLKTKHFSTILCTIEKQKQFLVSTLITREEIFLKIKTYVWRTQQVCTWMDNLNKTSVYIKMGVSHRTI